MGVPGGHAVQVNRLADAQAVRDALRLCPGADLAVIVSDRVFNDYLSDGYGSLSPAEFRQVRVRAKADTYTAYLYVAGCDLHELADLDAYAPGPPDSEEPGPPPGGPGTLVYGSAHKITDSVVNETHEGDINVGDISLGGKH
ncbi:hypothetical protein [Nonomuraea typhae]|uniref:Uncharacterized protein n=1 Tax=Nonomuraea typhae TaxID=2603600 RepID=A0ABW7YLF7_9ACTN